MQECKLRLLHYKLQLCNVAVVVEAVDSTQPTVSLTRAVSPPLCCCQATRLASSCCVAQKYCPHVSIPAMTLRLRLCEALPLHAPVEDGRAQLTLRAMACNESGSIMRLATPLAIRIRAVHSQSGLPIPSVTLRPSNGGPLPRDGRAAAPRAVAPPTVMQCVMPVSGQIAVSVEAHGRPGDAFRVCLSADGAASLAGRGSAPSSAPLAVLGVESNVVTLHRVAEAVNAEHVVAATRPDALALRECDVVVFSATGSAALRIYESPRRIAPGFGFVVWDAALALIAFVHANKATLLSRGRRTVDVGTGTGVVGIAAAAMGFHVVLTDVVDVLPLTAANAIVNAAAIAAGAGSTVTAPLVWGKDTSTAGDYGADAAPRLPASSSSPSPSLSAAASGAGAVGASHQLRQRPLLQHREPCSVATECGGRGHTTSEEGSSASALGTGGAERSAVAVTEPHTTLPLRLPSLAPPYDLILASEVAYREDLFDPLLQSLRVLSDGGTAVRPTSHRTVPDSEWPLILLAARRRASCELDVFIDRAAAAGFRVWLLAGDFQHAALQALDKFDATSPQTRLDSSRRTDRQPRRGGVTPQVSAVERLSHASRAAGAAEPPAAALARVIAALTVPPALRDSIAAAAALSKTGFAPLLFAITFAGSEA